MRSPGDSEGDHKSRTVTVLEQLFPNRADLLRLPAVLVTIHEHGLEHALELIRADQQRRALLTAWFAAAGWPELFGYLRAADGQPGRCAHLVADVTRASGH